jgi:predicted RNA-binding protein with PUA-like domain
VAARSRSGHEIESHGGLINRHFLQGGSMANYWLLKTEPSVYSFDKLLSDGTTVWDGVSSNAALKHMRGMKKGDRAIIYHSGDEKAVIGLAEIASDPFADPRQRDPKLVVVEVKAGRHLPHAVPLSEIKAEKSMADFSLVRIPRLSVMPVNEKQWQKLMKMAGA